MAKWKNSHNREESKITLGRFILHIHRHIHYPKDQWLASSHGIFSCRELTMRTLSGAKKEAIEIIKMYLQDAINDMIDTD